VFSFSSSGFLPTLTSLDPTAHSHEWCW